MDLEIHVAEAEPVVEPVKTKQERHIVSARIDNESLIRVRLSKNLPVDGLPISNVTITDEGNRTHSISIIEPAHNLDGQAKTFRIKMRNELDGIDQQYTIAIEGFGSTRVAKGLILVDSNRFFDPGAKLGANYTLSSTSFAVFSPVAEAVDVVIYDAPRDGQLYGTYALAPNDKGVWSATVEGNWKNKFYAYRLKGPGLDADREVTDIYAKCTTGSHGRGMIVDLAETDPPGFDSTFHPELKAPVDAVIYEMHVRDFTIAANSGVRAKGKFLGLGETGTHLLSNTEIKTGLDHLVELGVTHVQLMPVQDFDNNETSEEYNWGYMPICFNSPDGWYASTPVGAARISEFKQAVKAFHDRGIGVIMDVVYNHTAELASFEKLVPGYYFRLQADGSYWNGSGCGNELASEHPMARKFMIDSLTYWVREFGVDGFRFDLMGLHDLETMVQIREVLTDIDPSILVYGEPWTGGATGLSEITNQQAVAGTGIAAFNDHYRDAIKGGRDGGAPGFIQCGDHVGAIKTGIRGAVGEWAKSPAECLTYCECHDNLTTWDKLEQSTGDASLDVRKRMQRFAGLLVLSSQGIAFIHSGQEFCRTKKGCHNSYNQPDDINAIDWQWKKDHFDVFSYYRGLIALRRAHRLFRLPSKAAVARRLKFHTNTPSPHCIGYTLNGVGLTGGTVELIMVLLNGDRTDHVFDLPAGSWDIVVDADRAGLETISVAHKRVHVIPHSGMVLIRQSS